MFYEYLGLSFISFLSRLFFIEFYERFSESLLCN